MECLGVREIAGNFDYKPKFPALLGIWALRPLRAADNLTLLGVRVEKKWKLLEGLGLGFRVQGQGDLVSRLITLPG